MLHFRLELKKGKAGSGLLLHPEVLARLGLVPGCIMTLCFGCSEYVCQVSGTSQEEIDCFTVAPEVLVALKLFPLKSVDILRAGARLRLGPFIGLTLKNGLEGIHCLEHVLLMGERVGGVIAVVKSIVPEEHGVISDQENSSKSLPQNSIQAQCFGGGEFLGDFTIPRPRVFFELGDKGLDNCDMADRKAEAFEAVYRVLRGQDESWTEGLFSLNISPIQAEAEHSNSPLKESKKQGQVCIAIVQRDQSGGPRCQALLVEGPEGIVPLSHFLRTLQVTEEQKIFTNTCDCEYASLAITRRLQALGLVLPQLSLQLMVGSDGNIQLIGAQPGLPTKVVGLKEKYPMLYFQLLSTPLLYGRALDGFKDGPRQIL